MFLSVNLTHMLHEVTIPSACLYLCDSKEQFNTQLLSQLNLEYDMREMATLDIWKGDI